MIERSRGITVCLAAVALFAGGCAGAAYRLNDCMTCPGVDEVTRLRMPAPDSFTLVNSIVFSCRGRSINALGYTRVDTAARELSVAAMSPVGVKLFEFSSRQGELRTHFVIDTLAQLGPVTKAVSADVEKIYFDLFPRAGARPQQSAEGIRFACVQADEIVYYEYAGDTMDLKRKTLTRRGRVVWQVDYDDYRTTDAGRFAYRVELIDKRYKYRLNVNLKEIVS